MGWRERLIQTICEARNAYFADDVEHRRDGRDPDEVIADAILSAIDAAGCAIVLKEPTKEIVEAGVVARVGEGYPAPFWAAYDAEGVTEFSHGEQGAKDAAARVVRLLYRAMLAARPK